jgi:cysteinyl-tRNA synthetase
MLDRLYGALRGIEVSEAAKLAAEVPGDIVAALEDDLNSPKAMAAFFALAKELNKAESDADRQALAAAMYASGELMGLLGSDPEEWFAGDSDGEISPDEIEALIAKRNEAKAERDFEAADAIRAELGERGVTIQDSREGTTWRRS